MRFIPREKENPIVVPLFACLLFFAAFAAVSGQQRSPRARPPALWGALAAGDYEVGFKVIGEKDATRSFYKNTNGGLKLAEREIKIAVWYPAARGKVRNDRARKMKFAGYFAATGAANLTGEAKPGAQNVPDSPLLQELSDADRTKLLQTETAAARDAAFFKGRKFPLVIFGQGLYYEAPATHAILCEYLAAHGFVVATTELVGARSPFVKLDAVDLEAAVRDLEFVAARAVRLEAADPEKTAIVGFDMGGLAGLIYAMRNPRTDAYASLDSGILAAHNLALVKAMPDYDARRLIAPLLQATHPVAELARFDVREDASFIDAAVRSERLVLRFPDTRHADFTSVPMIDWTIAGQRDERAAHRRRSFETIAQSLLAFLKTHLTGDAKSRETLYGDASDGAARTVEFTKEVKPAAAWSGVSEDEFTNRLERDGAQRAAAEFRRLRARFPDDPIFREETLNQIGYNRLYRGAAAEAIRIFALNVEAFPASANARASLADAYRIAGDKERAILNYKKALALDPANENAKRRLKQLAADNAPN
jgi:dienelactone hydrolase